MNIQSICQREVVTIDRQCTLQEAAQRMREEHVGALVVTSGKEDDREVTGVITDRDLAIDAMARGLDATKTPVSEISGPRAVVIDRNVSISQALATMRAEGVRRLLVRGPDSELAGIVSVDDLIDVVAGELGVLASAIRDGIAREASQRPALPRSETRKVHVSLEGLSGTWQLAQS